MDNATQIQPTQNLKKFSELSLKERAELLFKKAQHKNGEGLAETAAENTARAELGVEPMTTEEIEKAKEPSTLTKIIDSKPLQMIGISALAHQGWQKVMGENQTTKIKTETDSKDSPNDSVKLELDKQNGNPEEVKTEEKEETKPTSLKGKALDKIHNFEDSAKEKSKSAVQGAVAAMAHKVGLEVQPLDDGSKTEAFKRVPEEQVDSPPKQEN